MKERSGSTKALHLAEERGEPIAVNDFHGRIVGHCADALAMHARDRASAPLAAVLSAEARIRRQREAVFSLESDTLSHIAQWWEQSAESADPWKAWAALFVIGSAGGPDLRLELLRALEQIPADDERWMQAGEALALAPIPDGIRLGHDLVRASGETARAVGIDLLSRRQAAPADLLREQLRAVEPAVAASAARSAARAGLVEELVPELLVSMHSPTAAVAWEAARALTLAGVREPYLEIQGDGPLAAVLGARGAEVLVMAGEDTDIDAFEILIGGTLMTPALLSAVARFGNVTAWSFLLHYLTEPDLVDAAVAALQTLFGPLVPKAEETSFSAWKSAIAEADLSPTVRYRAGKPWRPAVVVSECMSGALHGTRSSDASMKWPRAPEGERASTLAFGNTRLASTLRLLLPRSSVARLSGVRGRGDRPWSLRKTRAPGPGVEIVTASRSARGRSSSRASPTGSPRKSCSLTSGSTRCSGSWRTPPFTRTSLMTWRRVAR